MRRLIAAALLLALSLPPSGQAEESSGHAPAAETHEAAPEGHEPSAEGHKATEAEAPDEAAPQPAPGPSPTEIALAQELDALFLLQDATARGRQDAAALQKPLLLRLRDQFNAAPLAEAERLSLLVAAYVLSGGDPATAERMAKEGKLSGMRKRLLEGVALFMRGDRPAAAKLLLPLDTSRLPARLAGRVALAQALLEREPEARQQRLSWAAAAMPGTLVEESALRRSALGYAETAEQKHFWKRLTRYQRRFPDSLYARAFWEEAMDKILAWSSEGKAPQLDRLDLVLAELPVARRRALYLHLARQSAAGAHVPLTEYAARRVVRLAVPGSQEDQLGRLYLALYSIASETGEAARAGLASISPALLTPRERALREAGLAIAGQITRPAEAGGAEASEAVPEQSPLEQRGETLLQQAAKLIAESSS
jgi:chemotaxis protein MotC